MDVESGIESGSDRSTRFRWRLGAPGAKLTSFASRLAMLEKAAAGLGALGFIWASGVLLGGFASSLAKADFWFINAILLIEGIRIFSRRYIIRWQRYTPWSLTRAVNRFPGEIKSSLCFAFRCLMVLSCYIVAVVKERRSSRETVDTAEDTCERETVDTAEDTGERETVDTAITRESVILTKTGMFALVLYWFQPASSTTCVILSSMKLIKHICGDVGDANERNQQLALNIFYSLALGEALLFLLEKAYSEWMFMHRKLLEEVNRECQLEPLSIIYVKRFFYDTYSACVNESIFYGRQKDLVSFAMDLLVSNVFEDQLNGARILRKFAKNENFSDTTLQKVGIATSVMARLVEMLNWKEVEEEEIRQSAAEILLKLAGPRHKAPQIAGIPGVMESISSLLLDSRDSAAASDGIPVTMVDFQLERCDLLEFVNLGLRILKKLSRDHGSCGKIGNTRGLLPKIINFTYADERLLKGERTTPTQVLTAKRYLQVLKMLASTRGTTGKQLRKEISKVVFTISNIRGMLQHGEKHLMLQLLGIEILTSLAVEEDGRELIGCTGNVIKELFNIYWKQEVPAGPEHLNRVKVAAGEALSTLTLASTSNCHRILKLKVIGNLVRGLEDRVLQLSAARILRNLCSYSGGGFFDQLRDVVAAAPIVLKEISTEDKMLQEVMVGLAAQVFKFMTSQESSTVFERVGIQEADIARMLVQILKFHQYPLVTCPNMRRFVVELAICLMREKDKNVQYFKDLGMEKELEHVVETTSPLESFDTFSDSVGLSQHSTSIHSLVETAMELLAGKEVAFEK